MDISYIPIPLLLVFTVMEMEFFIWKYFFVKLNSSVTPPFYLYSTYCFPFSMMRLNVRKKEINSEEWGAQLPYKGKHGRKVERSELDQFFISFQVFLIWRKLCIPFYLYLVWNQFLEVAETCSSIIDNFTGSLICLCTLQPFIHIQAVNAT